MGDDEGCARSGKCGAVDFFWGDEHAVQTADADNFFL